MQKQKALQIQKLKNTLPWLVYYCIASVNFGYDFYCQIVSNIPSTALNDASFVYLQVSIFVCFSIYIQSPPCLLKHMAQASNELVIRVLMAVGVLDLVMLTIILAFYKMDYSSPNLIIIAFLVQMVIYSECILKLVVPKIDRSPVENYIEIFSLPSSIEDHMDYPTFSTLAFGFIFMLITLSTMLVFAAAFPLNTPYLVFLFKSLYCLVTFYFISYALITMSVLWFYLRTNTGKHRIIFTILKLLAKNIGVVAYMAIIKVACLSLQLIFAPLNISSVGRAMVRTLSQKYFSNLLFYKRLEITPIVILTTALEKEPHEAIEFIENLEITGDYPYINSFRSVNCVKTLKTTTIGVILALILPMYMILSLCSFFIENLEGYNRLLLSFCWASYATGSVWYFYSESLHYSALLSRIQGNPIGNRWVDIHLNSI
ncbi:uncharacterized protein NEMAJ01_0030 [Nematocida major]|uniref:uncharacterized protein n=1 Tax=Nematocida major TaxID=1912982 RepID=UPI002007E15A|nr:uncharacterized protein NEMAJ01_0030 [Nematocida major]KAH9385134.1 hypothetical protein NEMAJ01_0030 [Nematocida major]